MRFTPDSDAEDLRATVRAFLDKHLPVDVVFAELRGDRGWDPAVWRRFAGELGVVALDVPEELGGAGAGIRELAVVAEELGRVPSRLPWFSTAVLGVGVLTACDDAGDLLPGLLTGDTTATLAYLEDPAGWDPAAVATVAEPGADSWRLTGTKTLVVEGATADLLLVVARAGDELGLFAVHSIAGGLTRTPLDALDLNRQLARIDMARVAARRIAVGRDLAALVAGVLDRAVVALAAEQLGGAAAALDASVAYAAERLQFGRPIGTFQAIKHRCADMALQVEAARSAVAWATACADEAPEDLPAAVAVAGMTCGAAYRWVAGENVQVHGGIGFTWEHPAHLHLRRAATDAVLFGDEAAHRERLLAATGVTKRGAC
ncbi:acyl-CoA dehydrogenase family protein [Pseudonocardia sp. N23]|uniref:acyl-CoA dehydrogenase family protein n=1 Tax=Pseudonocardia sp. N23 TaxID=1987376 RepID=UPI000BFC296A|nr:acyl-CoA dehydrogenase family protein [Pseudonocardia sp. N23]GAY09584.1 butyryl-CoA dehydrogenase [Pseudonocardia sp. N23]